MGAGAGVVSASTGVTGAAASPPGRADVGGVTATASGGAESVTAGAGAGSLPIAAVRSVFALTLSVLTGMGRMSSLDPTSGDTIATVASVFADEAA